MTNARINLGQRAEMRVNARNVCVTADMRGLPELSCRVIVLRCIPANALTVVVEPGRKAVRHHLLGLPCECSAPTCPRGGPAHLFGAPRFS
jgi:hypothetical protein